MTGSEGIENDERDLENARWVLDVSPIVAVAALLVGVYTLPTAFQEKFVFEYGAPTLVTAYTAHFVHFSPTHLVGNIAAFTLVTGTMYALSVRADRRRIFFMFGATLLISFPVALSALNLAIPRDGVTYGFSGLNMALVGFLPVVVATHVERELGYPIDGPVLLAVFFASAGYIGAVALPWSIHSAGVTVAATALAVGFLFRYVASVHHCLTLTRSFLGQPGGPEISAVIGVVVWSVLVSIGFPEAIAEGSTITNIYVHFLGYALGFITAYLAYEWQLLGDRSATAEASTKRCEPELDRR